MPTVLVVDDSETDRRFAGGLLEKSDDWTVIFAADGRQALIQLEVQQPEIVVTDLIMPHMNGRELVEVMKREYPHIPVILMTAKGSEQIAVKALQYGAASYVPKRQLAQDLVDTVEFVYAAARHNRLQAQLLDRFSYLEIQFVVENDLSLLRSLADYMRQDLVRYKLLDEAERLRTGLAVEEALLNAYYHGNLEVSSELRATDHKAYATLATQRSQVSPYRERRIYVTARLAPSEVVYVIRDEGPGFDPKKLPDPTDPANLEKPSGRGLLLIQTFMDEVTFNETCNEVKLVKRANGITDPATESEEA
jgi:CheY-like chemotaxis protein/anti-sigma regulatory factor (Ser/Thr protein kinase)